MSEACDEGTEDVGNEWGGPEAWLDLMLGEELAVDLDFAAWFVGHVDVGHVECERLPREPPIAARVRFNVYESGHPLPPDSDGDAAVDLYLRDYGFRGSLDRLRALVGDIGAPEGFVPDIDMASPPNPILHYPCTKMPPSDGPPTPGTDDEAKVIDALQACSRAARWLHEHTDRLQPS